MKNIFFFDIDNTLLDHQTYEIPASALRAIEALKHAGHTIVVATGRNYPHAKPYLDLIKPSYAITQNGARILQGEQELMVIPLDSAALIGLFAWMQQKGHYVGANDGLTCYLNELAPFMREPLSSIRMKFQSDDPFYLYQNVYQGWLFFDERLDHTLIDEIRARYPQFDLVRWHPFAVDILPHGVNKWTGCQWVMARTGFQAAQAIAFGDGLNDMEMLQGVAFGVAMENAHPDLKAIAQRVAPALHLDGVAAVLEELASGLRRGLALDDFADRRSA